MLGGFLLILRILIDIGQVQDPFGYYAAEIPDYLTTAVGLLFMLGTAGLYAGYSRHSKTLGASGLNVVFVGAASIALSGTHLVWESDPLLMLGLIAMSGGLVFFGINSMRGQVFARWRTTLLFIIAAFAVAIVGLWYWRIDIFLGKVLYMLFAAGWVLLGYLLWVGQPSDKPEPK